MEIIEFAEKVKQSIMEQLATEKKPGLVCPNGVNPHIDIDYPLMLRGLTVINLHILTLAYAGSATAELDPEKAIQVIKKTGASAEKELLEATEGVNVLKGTFFATALFAACYFRLQSNGMEITERTLSEEIAKLAKFITPERDTKGAIVRESFDIGGALQEAQSGYETVFAVTLPMYRDLLAKGESKSDANRKVLLKLIATIDDTCMYSRQCSLVDDAKKIADYVLNNYTEENVDAMCSYFARTSLSTGGSGDLLILTILANKIFK